MDIRSIGQIRATYREQTNIAQSRKDTKIQPSSAALDQVLLSSHALEFSNTLKALKNTPEVREAKIKELSEKIDAGSYHVASSELAESIINYSKYY